MTERISFVDEDGILGALRMPILDRVLGAALAFLGAILTLALAPVILAFALPGLAAFQHPFFSWRLWGLFIWGALWLVPAAIAGWVAGFPKVLALFSYVWFTADPPNRKLSLYLWCGILFICLATSSAFWLT